MSASVQHPERLPWFAAGTLEPADAASIEGHLETCAECRAEVEALRSMARTLRAFAPTGHLTPEILVAYHGDPGALSPQERARLKDHLRSCLPCRADLRALLRADASLRTFSRRLLLGAAAALLVVALAGWQVASWRSGVSTLPLAHGVLMPGQRGEPVTIPAGRCKLDVLLPSLAPNGAYRARVQLPDGSPRSLGAWRSKDQWLTLDVDFAPGHHVLFLARQTGEGREEYEYVFDVEGSP